MKYIYGSQHDQKYLRYNARMKGGGCRERGTHDMVEAASGARKMHDIGKLRDYLNHAYIPSLSCGYGIFFYLSRGQASQQP